MIDPKQGPLYHAGRNAEPSNRSRPHSAQRASPGAAPEPDRARARPYTSNRNVSVVGS